MSIWQKRGGYAALAFLLAISLAQAGAERGQIGVNDAVRAAVARSGGGEAVAVRFADTGFRPLYRVLIVDATSRFDVDVDAVGGQVVKFAKRDIDGVKLPPRGMANGGVLLRPETVKPAALAATGGGLVVKTDRILGRHGGSRYDFEIVKDNAIHRVVIDADSGAVVLYEEESFEPLLTAAAR